MEEQVVTEEIQESPSAAESVEAPEATVEDSAPSESASEPASEPAASDSGSIEEAIAELTPDSFDWNSWQGDDFSQFPEYTRSWLETLYSHANSRLDQERAALEELSGYYNELLTTGGDPRVKTLEEKLEEKLKELEEIKVSGTEWEVKYQEAVKRAEAIEQAWKQKIEAEREEKASQFAEENDWLFDGKEDDNGNYVAGPKESEALEIVGEGWPYQALPVIMKLPKGLRGRAREYMKQYPGSNPELILKSIAKSVERPASESDDLVSGSNGSKISAQTVTTALPTNLSPHERRLAIIRNNMSKLRS